MKRIITICAAILMTASVFLPQQARAQSPEKMSYQAVVRDASNTLVTSTAVGMQISLLQGSPSGVAVYVETHTPTSNTNGLVSLEIGAGTVVSGTFASIDWANGPYFIETETDPTGGINYSITGTSQLMSVPYALHAKTAESAVIDNVDDADADVTNELQNIDQVLVVGNDANGNNIVNTGKIGIGTATPNAESSMEIATALPVIFPAMTQTEVNAITSPVPGMVQYNTTLNKLQVYSNQEIQSMIVNELYTGTESSSGIHIQSVLPEVTGNIVAVEVLIRQDGMFSGICEFTIEGQGFSLPISNYTSLTWHTFNLPTPVPVTAGIPFSMNFDYPGSQQLSFATNSNYLDGSGCCYGSEDDILFRIHIETSGEMTWLNMH